MSEMCDLIKIVETMLRHGQNGVVPDTLYHGTSLQNYIDIRATDTFEQDSEEKGSYGFSTTEDEAVAVRFARMKAGGRWVVVLTLDGTALAARFQVEPFTDDDLGNNYEWEWVVISDRGPLSDANRFITEVRVIDTEGDPSHLLPWDDAVHNFDQRAAKEIAQKNEAEAIRQLKRSHTPDQARIDLLTAAQAAHPEQSRNKLRALIDALDDDALYRMLRIYLLRK